MKFQHGDTWSTPEACACYLGGNSINGRFVKIELSNGASGDAESAVSLLTEGRHFTSNLVTKTVVNRPCHGAFGSIDLELYGHDVPNKCDDLLVTVQKTGGQTFVADDVILQESAFVHVEKESFSRYGKCVLSFVVEAFQAEFNGEYTVTAKEPGSMSVLGGPAIGSLQV